MRLYLQLVVGVAAALIATFLILKFKLYETPLLLGGLLLIACCFGPLFGRGVVSPPPDAARPDAARPDAARPDAARPDAARPDAARPDAARPDAARPDAARPDAARPDAARPDAARPDAARPDAARPDAARPEKTTEPTTTREEGEVKWFNVSKGFGFIRREHGEEIFVHFRSIRGPHKDRRQLRDGQRVSFEVRQTEKGPQAEDVIPIARKT